MNDQRAEWTIMIYMNADSNGLETEAFGTMAGLAEFGSTDQVNIVVQLDLGKFQSHDRARWQHARRFHIRHGLPVHHEYALPGFANNVNMGAESVLFEFVEWATTVFPARHSMLVIWGHGQGYGAASQKFLSGDVHRLSPDELAGACEGLQSEPTRFHTALVDHASDNDPLHLRELQAALKSHGSRLDIIGFDSCLMAMLEVAHAVRNCGIYMLASEEVLPGSGWSYGWLAKLFDDPLQPPKRLALSIVEEFRSQRENTRMTRLPRTPVQTFSALRLDLVDGAAVDLDHALDLLMKLGEAGRKAVVRARKLCHTFGYSRTTTIRSIDLYYFLDNLCEELDAEPVLEALKIAKQSIRDVILDSDASQERVEPPYGAHGLAIYFPSDRSSIKNDPYSGCYFGNDSECPQIEFATAHRWRQFLLWFLDPSCREWNFGDVTVSRPKGANMAKRYPLDEIEREFSSRGEGLQKNAERAPAPEICENWPLLRKFLEWAKTQTQNPDIRRVIDMVIVLGDSVCAGVK